MAGSKRVARLLRSTPRSNNKQGNNVALSDIEIAQAATLKPIVQLAQDRLGIPLDALEP